MNASIYLALLFGVSTLLVSCGGPEPEHTEQVTPGLGINPAPNAKAEALATGTSEPPTALMATLVSRPPTPTLIPLVQPTPSPSPNSFVDRSYRRRTPFVPLDNPAVLSVNEATYLDNDELVLGLEWDGAARAYPIRMIKFHHIVNDTVADHPLAITY